jgi:hypothetical protein
VAELGDRRARVVFAGHRAAEAGIVPVTCDAGHGAASRIRAPA